MSVVLILHGLLVLAFTVRILLRDDLSPPGRLAWFVVLNLLPYFGSIIYFLFGEIDIGNKANQRHAEIFTEIKTKAAHLMGKPQSTDSLIKRVYRPAFQYASSINGFYTLGGNSAHLMPDSDTTLTRMIDDIDAATEHVHVLYYIWLNDCTGTELAEALIRAARRGVICRAMADGLGSRAFIKSSTWQRMQDAGVEVAVALPFYNVLRVILASRFDLRNHRKITVIDGRITYCGSQNSADPEFLIKEKYGPWIDIMLRFEGPVVAQNQLLFISDWMQATGQSLDAIALPKQSVEPLAEGFPAQVMGVGPTERRGATPHLFATLFACAEHSLILTTPYFVPDATVLEALCAAAYRGVKVTLIYPRKNDSWIVAAASRSYYHKLLDAGCLIYEHREGLLHAKTLTVDGQVSLIGSSNLDLRSFDLNYENNIVLQDSSITAAIEARQQQYLEGSEPVLLSEVLAWRYYRRVWNNVIATIGPVL
ncbi:cardiolipin synthase [Denitrificimonas sp. JX-1]|uniref:Cardiolipin synthase n=1 Tax=Denitrificimonas halotolerans TaxID=3098930 RepID=A0ABU5GP52_9GAMM|nr:cardiolipin synthase [Denitrificimonas sp. JX-1]MDY7218723.1 cardiolipin synthase [Denitrificimonas sp. JX-1]